MFMRLAHLGDWVHKQMKQMKWKQTTLDINPDKVFSVQEFKDEFNDQRYVVVIIQALMEGVDDNE